MRAYLFATNGTRTTIELTPEQMCEGDHPEARLVIDGVTYALDEQAYRKRRIIYRQVSWPER